MAIEIQDIKNKPIAGLKEADIKLVGFNNNEFKQISTKNLVELNSKGKIPAQYLDLSDLKFMGVYDAENNVPGISDNVGNDNEYYIVNVPGTQDFGSGNLDLNSGDYLIFYDGIWNQVIQNEASIFVNNVEDLRNLNAKEGDTITLLGYYTIGDKSPINYKFTFDNFSTNIDDGGAIIKSSKGSWIANFGSVINVDHFGAIGDGVTDDSNSFRKANLYGFNKVYYKPNLTTYKGAQLGYSIELTGSKVYYVEGSNILGSPLDNDSVVKNNYISFHLISNGSNINWKPLNKTDFFFNINFSIVAPSLSNVNIYNVLNSALPDKYNGILFNITSSYLGGKEGAKGLHLNNCNLATLNGGYFYRIINILGNTQADQMRFTNVSFSYFQNVVTCENQESVNNVFDKCSFFGGDNSEKVYFYFSKMGDNFSVNNSNFSIKPNETILKTRSNSNLDGQLLQSNSFKFNFSNNRYEFYENGEHFFCDVDFGDIYISNSNLRLASGNVKSRFKAIEKASITIDDVTFGNMVDFIAPVYGSKATWDGNLLFNGITVKNSNIPTQDNINYSFGDYDTEYSIKDVMLLGKTIKKIVFENCQQINRNNNLSYEINPFTDVANITTSVSNRIFQKRISNGINAVGSQIRIEPFQEVLKIRLSFRTLLPNTFKGVRIYFGDVSNNLFVDSYIFFTNSIIMKDWVVFEGSAIFLTKNNNITIKLINSDNSISNSLIGSDVIIDYASINNIITSDFITDVKIIRSQKRYVETIGNINYLFDNASLSWKEILINKSAAVGNVISSDATDLPTVITLANELKTKLNAKLLADRNSGQQSL